MENASIVVVVVVVVKEQEQDQIGRLFVFLKQF